jgi:hypothetical protein
LPHACHPALGATSLDSSLELSLELSLQKHNSSLSSSLSSGTPEGRWLPICCASLPICLNGQSSRTSLHHQPTGQSLVVFKRLHPRRGPSSSSLHLHFQEHRHRRYLGTSSETTAIITLTLYYVVDHQGLLRSRASASRPRLPGVCAGSSSTIVLYRVEWSIGNSTSIPDRVARLTYAFSGCCARPDLQHHMGS